MAKHHNPKVVTTNLLLNLDFKNSKRFSTTLGSGNLIQNFNYNASTWTNIFPTAATLTTGIDAPDGSKTAVRMTCNTSGQSLLRASFTGFTPNGTDTYGISFWVRKISGSTSSSNQLLTDLHDNISFDYRSILVDNKYVRVMWTGVPSATTKTFLDLLSNNVNDYVLDFWGVKIENLTSTNNEYPIKDTFGGLTFNNYRPQYTTFDENIVSFTRTASAPKHGGLAYTTGTGSLTSGSFLYNDHTWEVWFKIDDINPGAYDANEQWSALAMYRGYHAGFIYTASTMAYSMWDNTGPTNAYACSWTVGASGAQINQGSWYQIVVVRSGSVFTPYLNGVQVGTGSTRAFTAFSGVSNDIHLGAAANVAAGASSYVYYARNSIANMKMYNRALTAAEISQNFNALRGRFGI